VASRSHRYDDELPLPKPGWVSCLGPCGGKFLSRDVRTNRLCPVCTEKLKKEKTPRVARLGHHHGGGPVETPGD
jgi:hypothetical protein